MREPAAVRRIPLLDVREHTRELRAELEAALGRVLDHGRFIQGPEVARFEQEIAAFCGTRFAVGCASGSDALLLAYIALGVQPGDRVITTPYTFFATVSSVTRLGGTPVFVDIDPHSFNMNPDLLRRRLAAMSAAELRTVRAIVPIHLFGQCCEMDPILETAREYGIPVIEDAAQAVGALWRERRAGSMGRVACFSFFPSKNLGGLGDGGMLTTDDEELAAQLRLLREHGAEHRYYHRVVGINSRLDTLQAAPLLVKLGHLEPWTEARRRNAERYGERLRDMTDVRLPCEADGCWHVYNQYVIRVPERDRVKLALEEAGIGTAIYYPVPLHLQECFAYLGCAKGDFPESEAAARTSLALPIGPELSEEDIEYVAMSIRQTATIPARPESRE